jgi:hypothetical protein
MGSLHFGFIFPTVTTDYDFFFTVLEATEIITLEYCYVKYFSDENTGFSI